MEERTEWREQNGSHIWREEKWQACWCCGDQQTACRMAQVSAEKLEHTGPAENNRLSATERAVGKYAGATLAKRKRAVSPKYQIMRGERVKVGESRTLTRERGIRAGG